MFVCNSVEFILTGWFISEVIRVLHVNVPRVLWIVEHSNVLLRWQLVRSYVRR